MAMCPYCNEDQAIIDYKKDNPVFACGHVLYPEGTDNRVIQDSVVGAGIRIRQIMQERRVCYDEACNACASEHPTLADGIVILMAFRELRDRNRANG